MSGDNQTGGGGTGGSNSGTSTLMPGSLNAISSQLAAGYGGTPDSYLAYLNSIYPQSGAGHSSGSGSGSGSGNAPSAGQHTNHPGISNMRGGGKLGNRFADALEQAMQGYQMPSGGILGMMGQGMPSNWQDQIPADWQSQMGNFWNRGG